MNVSPPPRSFEGANLIGHRAGPLRRQIIVATPADAPLGDYSNGGNADGLALLLALARYANELSPRPLHQLHRFRTATHRGYVGSRWYLAHLPDDERASIDAVLTFDRPGRSHPLQLGASQSVAPLIDRRLAATGDDLRVVPDSAWDVAITTSLLLAGFLCILARVGAGESRRTLSWPRFRWSSPRSKSWMV